MILLNEGHGQGSRPQGGQSFVRLGHGILLQSETLLHDLAQLQEHWMGPSHEEGLELDSASDGRFFFPSMELERQLQLRDERQ